jgi:type IV secretory pathway VirB10-like protein
MSAATGPGLIPRQPTRVPGVRRLGPALKIAACFVLFLFVLVIGYTLHTRGQSQATQAKQTDAATGASDEAGKQFSNFDTTTNKKDSHTDSPKTDQPKSTEAAKPPVDMAEQARLQAWQAYYQQQAQEDQSWAQRTDKAYTSSSEVNVGQGGGGPGGISGMPGMPAMAGGVSVAGGNGPAYPAGTDAGAQAEKRAFLSQGGDVLGLNEDVPGAVHGPKHDTIMATTAVPGVMVGGMNSDMPGMIVGQIQQNICDSETGNDLLIPFGTKVQGHYDNSVSNGQTRIGFVWTRFVFPDTSSRQIGAMEGADEGGYAGAHDQVDTHFWPNLWKAVVVSIIGAGAQLAQPPPSTNGFYSPWSTGTGAITNQMQQFALSQANSGGQIPNTLEVRPGYQFRIMFQADLHLPVYHGMSCDGGSAVSSDRPINLGPILQ